MANRRRVYLHNTATDVGIHSVITDLGYSFICFQTLQSPDGICTHLSSVCCQSNYQAIILSGALPDVRGLISRSGPASTHRGRRDWASRKHTGTTNQWHAWANLHTQVGTTQWRLVSLLPSYKFKLIGQCKQSSTWHTTRCLFHLHRVFTWCQQATGLNYYRSIFRLCYSGVCWVCQLLLPNWHEAYSNQTLKFSRLLWQHL